jgi:hypothetical protein
MEGASKLLHDHIEQQAGTKRGLALSRAYHGTLCHTRLGGVLPRQMDYGYVVGGDVNPQPRRMQVASTARAIGGLRKEG